MLEKELFDYLDLMKNIGHLAYSKVLNWCLINKIDLMKESLTDRTVLYDFYFGYDVLLKRN